MVSVWFLMVSAVYRDRNNGSSPVICNIGFERRFSIFMGEFLSVGKKALKKQGEIKTAVAWSMAILIISS